MTPKERILFAITGKKTDRLPWSPFLAYFWEAQPQEIQQKGQEYFLNEIGADPIYRGFHQLFSRKYKHCNIREDVKGEEKFIVYETPVGNLHTRSVFSTAGNTWFLVEHPVKTREDFKILTYLNEDAIIIPDKETFLADYDRLGQRGLYVPLIGTEWKTGFQSLIETWVGTEELVYALMDYPEVVEEALNAMQKKSLATVEISIQSPAEAFIFWEDSSTTNISPALFEKYAAPEINAWGKIVHGAEKLLIHHACGHLRALISLMAKNEIDVIESISPPPTGNIELWEADEILPEHIALIGGIEPTVFLNSTLDELEEYVLKLIKKMENRRFVLANSDSCPPGVSIEKFKLVAEIVRRVVL